MPATSSQRVFVQDALVTADSLAARVRTMLGPNPTPERQAIANEVFVLLKSSTDAARGVDPRYRLFVNWWRKPMLDAAYEYLHAARTHMVLLYEKNDLEDALPSALATIRREFDQRDPRRVKAEAIPQLTSTEARRGALRAGLEAAYASSDAWHRRQRSFRNILVLATIGISVLVLSVALLVFQRPDFMPFCFDNLQPAPGAPTPAAPGLTTATEVPVTAVQVTSCPTGQPPGSDQSPASSWDIVMVALMGLLGGSLAAAVSIRHVQGVATPYDIPVVLATLKVPTGALTAIAGLIAIRGDFVPGLSGLDSQEQILAYALVLGYAQQLATGFLDRRAQSLTEEPSNATLGTGAIQPAGPTGGPGGGSESGAGKPGDSGPPAKKAATPTKATRAARRVLRRDR